MSYNVLELLNNLGVPTRKVSSGKHGDEYHSSCPVCGDGSPRRPDQGQSDRFQVWPSRKEGGYFVCRKCGIYGDNIQFIRETEKKSYPEACATLGIALKGSCNRPRLSTPKPPVSQKPEFQAHTYAAPCEEWQEKCGEFVHECHQHLMTSGPSLLWLAKRGITKASVVKYQLGYNPGHSNGPLYKSRKAWGLPPEESKKRKEKPLWLPIGLVVPLLDENGQVLQARIRRTEEDRTTFLPGVKYYVIPGGCQATMVLNSEAKCFVVIEAGLDAILVAQEAEGLNTGAITTWNVSAKPDAATTELLHKSLKILVALDADGPGEKQSNWWKETFRQAYRHAPVGGKDPGEACAAGHSIRDWLLSGLPPVITRFADKQPAATTPEIKPTNDPEISLGSDPQKGESEEISNGAQQDDIEALRRYMLRYRVTISKDAEGGIKIKGLRRCPSDDSAAITDLVWYSDTVDSLINRHPCKMITAGNLLAALPDKCCTPPSEAK